MNSIFAITLMVAFAALASGQLFGEVDQKTLENMLKNKALVESQGKCITAPDAEANVICDKTGKKLRVKVPEAIQLRKCPEPCNAEDKKMLTYLLTTLKRDHSVVYRNIITHFKVTPEHEKELDDYLAKNPVTP